MKLRSMLNTLYILGTEAEEGITLALGPVPHRNVAARPDEVGRHGRAHDPEPQEPHLPLELHSPTAFPGGRGRRDAGGEEAAGQAARGRA